MTKRRLLHWSLIVAVLAAFAVWLEPTRVVWGWLRGEAFYQRRPTSWWANELLSWEYRASWETDGIDRWTGQPCRRWMPPTFHRNTNSAEELIAKLSDWFNTPKGGCELRELQQMMDNLRGPTLLKGDPEARRVLVELTCSVEKVKRMAEYGLKRIDGNKRVMPSK